MKHFPIFAVLLLVTACKGGDKKPSGPPAVAVAVATAVKKDVPRDVRAVGSVEPFASVLVVPQVGGTLESASFQPGQEVTAGQALFKIDPRPYQAVVTEQEAMVSKAEAEAKYATSQAERYRALLSKEYVSKGEYDDLTSKAQSLKATLQAARASLETAKLNLSYTDVRSPLNGRTGDMLVKPGNIVRANDASSPLVKIDQFRPIFVRFTIPEQYVSALRSSGPPPVIRAETQSGPVTGSLDFIDSSVDRTTGSILLKAKFDNEDGKLWPGIFVPVTISIGIAQGVIVVPSESILPGQKGPYLFVVNRENKVENRQVVVDIGGKDETALKSGVNEGETVVTDGQLNLAPGATVQVKSARGDSAPGT